MPPALKARVEAVRLAPAPANPMSAGAQWGVLPLVAGVGTEIDLSFCPARYLPMRLRWTARITEFAWYSHFCDEQVRGPFLRFSHRHGIRSEIQEGRIGTLLTDEIEYALPFGSIGHLWDAAVRRQLKRTFSLRQERLPKMLEQMVRQTA
jgi:ligand-binding SRPBCC domain-containing protein